MARLASRLFVLLLLAVYLSVLSIGPALAQGLQPGSFSTKGGRGTLELATDAKHMTFALETVGAQGRHCELMGTVDPNTGDAIAQSPENPKVCKMSFQFEVGSIAVMAKTPAACATFCGAGIGFEQKFYPVSPICDPTRIQNDLTQFADLPPGAKPDYARTHFDAPSKNCADLLGEYQLRSLRQARAIAAHQVGRNDQCRAILRPDRSFMVQSDDDILDDHLGVPEGAEAYVGLAKSLRDTYALCQEETK